MMTQKQAILKYLKTHKGITTWTGFELGITRLSERIRELEADGVKIVRSTVHGTNRYGNPVRLVKYSLK